MAQHGLEALLTGRGEREAGFGLALSVLVLGLAFVWWDGFLVVLLLWLEDLLAFDSVMR